MKATKILTMIVCGISFTHVNADINQKINQQQEGEMVIVNIWINGLDYKTEAVTFSKDAKKFIECQSLKNVGVRIEKLSKDSIKKDFCLLNSPEVKFEDDQALQAIKIHFPPDYFEDTQYDLNTMTPPEKANFGGFLNYSLFYSKDDYEQDFNTFSELGVFKDYWLLKNSFLYRNNPNEFEKKLLRVNSTLDIEFPEKFLILTLGDTTSPYNTLNNSFRFGGLSIGTNYTDRPDFIYWNAPTLKGSAALPSTVDLYLNGIQLYKNSVTPGNYSLPTGALINQAGSAQIVVEDILGNRTVRSFPIYINNLLLKPKLNEYNFSLGKLRYNYDEVDDDYRDFFSKLFFRRGITSSTTLGGDILYSEKASNASLLWTQALSKFLLLDTAFAVSDAENEQGYGATVSLSRDFINWSFGISSHFFSEEYKYISDEEFNSNIKTSNLVYFNFYNLKYIDGLNISYIDQTNYSSNNFDPDDRKIFDIIARKNLTNNLYSTFGFFKDFGDDEDYGFNIAFNYDWVEKGQINLNHDTESDETRLSFRKTTMTQNGFDYVLGVNRIEDEINYNAYGLWKTDIGNLRVSHDEYEDNRVSQAMFEGAVVWLGNKAALTKYADNAFALVNVNNHPDLDIYKSSSLVGSTNDKGYMFVHHIIPYINYDISFDQNQLPMEETFENSSKKLVGLDQRGYKIDFPIHKTKRIAINIKDINGKNLLAGSEVQVEGMSTEPYFIDSDGMVYLYVSKPDRYNLIVKTQGGGAPCQSQFVLSQNQFENLGNQVLSLVCK